jgi:hypothetical protein
MSHFTEVKTKIKNKERLKKVLSSKGFEIEEDSNGVEVRGYFGDTIKAEFKILTKSHYDIGFVKDDQGNYEAVGDWELMPKVSGIEQTSFINEISQSYAIKTVEEMAEEKGYSLEMGDVDEEGNIQMVVTEY